MMKISVNNKDTEIDDTTITVSHLIRQLKLNRLQIAVEVNTELVPREDHDNFELHAGDQVEVVTLVGGG